MQYRVPKLPLLEYTVGLFPRVNLEKTLIIGVQHILPTTHSLFHVLFSMGLKPANLVILGKCYSTNPYVFCQLEQDGARISKLSMFFDSHTHYDHQFDDIIKNFLQEILSKYDFKDYERVLFLDDGGHLLEEIYRLDIKISSACGIEQTSSGYNRTKHLPFNFPIINLARSWMKLRFETPLIIREVLKCLNHSLKTLEIEDCSVLILGNGVLGNVVYQSLPLRFKANVYDINPNRSLISSEHLIKTIENSNLIIGCTGTTSLSQEVHKHITPSTILASMSSSDREFDAVYLRKQAPLEKDCHRHMDVNRVQLLNCGFPINFSSDYPSVDSSDFQITRSLILASIAQIHLARGLQSGFHDLDNAVQQNLMQEFLNLRDSIPSVTTS